MLRIHFTADDLGRVRLAAGADPLWETRLSARVVNDPEGARGALGQWRSEVVRDLPRQALPYLHLTPSRGYSPDFLVPETGSVDLASGIQAVLGTPAGRMAAELARLDVASPLSGWVHYLASGAPRALQGLRATITAYHRHAVAPVWDRVWSAVEADRAAHAHGLVTEGARDTLAALHPRITWSGHTLRIDDGRHDRDIHLAGRGLRLVPSYFCGDVPVTFEDPGLTPALVLPVVHSPYEAASRDESAGAALALLLGRTRAAALRALATPVTTGALARRTSASPASASQHAAVLRQAGLVVSRRDGRYVVHTLTTLGARLLAAAERGEAATGRQRPPKPAASRRRAPAPRTAPSRQPVPGTSAREDARAVPAGAPAPAAAAPAM